jgi:hypothetical protein
LFFSLSKSNYIVKDAGILNSDESKLDPRGAAPNQNSSFLHDRLSVCSPKVLPCPSGQEDLGKTLFSRPRRWSKQFISLQDVNIFLSSYAAWSGYPYNQQGNPGAYSYGGSDSAVIPNAASSSYPQYSQHQSNSQYSYGASNANEYYSHYGYGAPHPTSSVYADPNGLFSPFIL